jgi:two-component system, response regulator YesN
MHGQFNPEPGSRQVELLPITGTRFPVLRPVASRVCSRYSRCVLLGTRRRKAFAHYLITHALLMLVAIALAVAAVGVSIVSVRRITTETWSGSFAASVRLMEARVSDTLALVDRVTTSRAVRQLLLADRPLPPERYIQLRQATDYIRASGTELGIAEDIVVYLDRPGVVATRTIVEVDWRRFFGTYLVFPELDLIDLETALSRARSEPEFWPVTPVESERYTGDALIISQSFPPQNQSYRGVALLIVPVARILEHIVPPGGGPDAAVTITTPDGRLLFDSSPPDFRPGERTGSGKGERIAMDYSSDVSGLVYGLKISGEVVWRELRRLRILLLGSIGMMALIGLALSFFFAERNSRPLRLLARQLAGEYSADSRFQVDEIVAIDRSARRLLSANTEMRSELQRQRPLAQTALLNRLFAGDYHDELEAQNAVASVGLDLGPAPYCVVVVQVLGGGEAVSAGTADLVRAVIVHALQEELGREAPYIADPWSRAVILLGAYDEAADLSALGVVKDALEEDLKVPIAIAIGSPVDSVIELRGSYEAAERVAEYLRFFRSAAIVPHAVASERAGRFSYPLDVEVDLIRMLRQGNQSGVDELLARLIDDALRPDRARIVEIQRFFTDLVGTAARAAAQLLLPQLSGSRELRARIDELPRSSLEPEDFEELRSILTGIAAAVAGQTTDRARSTYERAVDVIERDYGNAQLSLAYVAESVGLSESYLSTLFRSVSGEGYFEYVERVRMRAAQGSLVSTDDPIQEIARSCGYTNANTFFKAFKRVHGMTPVQYRRGHRANPPGA